MEDGVGRMAHRWGRGVSRRAIGVALALLLVASANPLWEALAPTPQVGSVAAADAIPPAPQARTLPPASDPHLPSLAVHVAVAPDPIVVGQPATITLTVSNNAHDPATGLAITLPLPAGATAQTPTVTLAAPAPGAGGAGWTWSPPLGARSSTTVTATVIVAQQPAGGALVVTPSVTAQGLARPVQATGGALVGDPGAGAATQPFTPGTAATLTSADKRVTVNLPDKAAATGLTLKHDTKPPAGEAAPRPSRATSGGWASSTSAQRMAAGQRSTSSPSR